jgi:di/tricarboxylate transporter
MFGTETILYISILYGIFFAVPLLFFVLYIVFKPSERENEEVNKEEIKRSA